MSTGDVGHGSLPEVRAGMGHAEVLRSIRQSGNIAVRRTAARALLDHPNQIACRIRFALKVADAERGAAIPCLEKQTIRQRRGPRNLGDIQAAPEDTDSLGGYLLRLGQARRCAGTPPGPGPG